MRYSDGDVDRNAPESFLTQSTESLASFQRTSKNLLQDERQFVDCLYDLQRATDEVDTLFERFIDTQRARSRADVLYSFNQLYSLLCALPSVSSFCTSIPKLIQRLVLLYI